MRRWVIIVGPAVAVVAVTAALLWKGEPQTQLTPQRRHTMQVTSAQFKDNENIPKKYTCQGDNISPPLDIKDVPSGAQSLVLTVEDPDAPGGTFDHWLVWNIPVNTQSIPEAWHPEQGITQGTSSFGKQGYGGPCPPSGTHRYVLTIYALDIKVELPSSANKAALRQAMSGHVLDSGQLIGLYAKQG